ncbi:mitochondrial carrier domain-containing protein [Chytridium lagenaria]|nr:mitochondrial carrier domain-containing protein [Chytridium lagenaria]
MTSTETKPKPLPVYMSLTAGAIAGVTEILTRFQLQVTAPGSVGYKEGFGALYRGILPPIMVEAPKRSIKFSANEEYGKLYKVFVDPQGISAGATESLVVVSPDLVKIRLQDKRNIYAEEGFFGFWKGLEATALRHIIWNAGYFGVIQANQNEVLNCGTILNTPFDVVKSRVQGQIAGHLSMYNWAFPALATIVREEGFGALYKGFLPKVLRLGPGGVVTGFMRKTFL